MARRKTRQSVQPRVTKKSRRAPPRVYQFKIELMGSKPPIWRRIQVLDGTLDQLHEVIHTAMGWTNRHLYHFHIDDQFYSDPEQERFASWNCADSTITTIGDIVPQRRTEPFRFIYEYAYYWFHDVLLEELAPADPKQQYPVCLAGERACPPDNLRGIHAYEYFLKVIHDPCHDPHDEYLDRVGGPFDPEAFNAIDATRAVRSGLPNRRAWR